VLLAFGLRVYRLGYQSLWEDEVHSVVRGNLSLSVVAQDILSTGNQAPLYYLTMHFWQFLGDDELVVRYFSVICGALATAMLLRLGRSVRDRWTGLIAGLLLAVSPLHVWYSQETRMYSLVVLLAIVGNYLLLRAVESNRTRHWLGYTVCMLALVYAHYLTGLMVVAHFMFLFVNRRSADMGFAWRRWVLWMAVAGIVYLPWLMVVGQHGETRTPNIGWISPVHWSDPLLTLRTFGLGHTSNAGVLDSLAFFSLAGASLLAIVQTLQAPHLRREQLLVHWLLTPLLLLFLVSWVASQRRGISLYVDRYLLFTFPAFLLLAARGLRGLGHRSKLLTCAAMAMVLLSTYQSLNNLYLEPAFHRENWRDAVAYLRERWSSGDIVVTSSDPHFVALDYYHPGDIELRTLPLSSYARDESDYLSKSVRGLRLTNGLPPARYWVISGLDNLDIHGFPQQRNALVQAGCPFDQIKVWFDDRHSLLSMQVFNGICLSLYAN